MKYFSILPRMLGSPDLNAKWESPGKDSFMKEFYVAFFGELRKILVSVLHHAFEVGELSSSQKTGCNYSHSKEKRG